MLEEKKEKHDKYNPSQYEYERVFDLAVRLGYINKKGVYLQD